MAGWRDAPLVEGTPAAGGGAQPAWASAPLVEDAPPRQRGFLQEAGRQLGLTARHAAQGVASLADMANNAAGAVLNAPFIAWDALRGNAPGTSEPFRYGAVRGAVDAGADAAGLPEPQTGLERVVGMGSEAIAGAAPANLLAAGARAAAPVLGAVRDGLAINTVGDAGINALAGVAGGAAAEAAPDQWKAAAGAAGALSGVGLPLAAAAGVRAAGGQVRRFAEPMLPGGPERLAADRLQGAASDPAAVRAALSQGPIEIVPGSVPTTAQQTGDMGLLALERGVQTRAPDQFADRRAAQNTARQEAINGVRGEGDAMTVPQLFRRQLDELNAAGEAEVEAARQAGQAEVGQARAAADTAGASFGGQQGTPEGYGAQLRGVAQEADSAARAAEGRLWQAVDPDGSLALDVTPVRQAAREIMEGQTPSARPLSPAEGQIFGVASGYQDVMPFRDLVQLRANVSAAMREELRSSGRTPSYGRLAQFRGRLEDALETAVERQVAREAAGEVPASGAGIADQPLWADVRDWYERRAQVAAQAGGGGWAGAVPASPGGSRAAAFPPFGDGSFQGRPADGGVGRSISRDPEALSPNFTAEAADRLRVASDATRQRAETFGRGPAGEVLRRGETADTFRIPDSAVPDRIFTRGPGGFERVQAFRNAVGDDQALQLLSDYAALSLRRTATRADGSLDPAAIQRWQRAHADALRAFPELSARFTGAADAETAVAGATSRAEQTIAEAVGRQREQTAAYQRTAAARFLKPERPDEVVQAVGGMFGSSQSRRLFRELSQQIGDDGAAREGMKRAIVEHIQQKLIGNTEVAASSQAGIKADQFQTFMRQNQAALREFFSEPELRSLNAVALDLQQSARSQNAARIPGGSNTVQDTAAAANFHPNNSLLKGLMTGGAGALAGSAAAGPIGAAAGSLIGGALTQMRKAGFARSEQILTEAMLDPTLARMLLMKATPANGERVAKGLRRYLARNARAVAVGTEAGAGRKDGR